MLEDHEVVALVKAGSPVLYDEIDYYLLGPETDSILEKYPFLTRYGIYTCIAECYFDYGYSQGVEWWWQFLYDTLYRSYESEMQDSDEDYGEVITEVSSKCLAYCPALAAKFKGHIETLGRGVDGLYIQINDNSFESTHVVWTYEPA